MNARILAVMLVALPASAQVFSPGELTKSHEQLEGLSNCKKCHGDGEQISAAKCLDCHQELGQRVRAKKGFHGRMSESERACQSCHHEHQGKSFAIVEWVPAKKTFPHAKTGWALEGKHHELGCEECHQPRRVFDAGVKALLEKHPGAQTFLGTSMTCSACHFDEHRGQLDDPCETCHTPASWKTTKGFNHAKTDYPLTGKHRKVACRECHPQLDDPQPDAFPKPVGESFLKFSPIAHRSCLDCHEDPHDDRFGQRCASCHTTADWRTVKTPGGDRAFHDKTHFPLQGAHQEVECRACHGPFKGIAARFKGLPFKRCDDCHADAHEGQLRQGKRGGPDCDVCHTVSGFTPARFALADHQKTRFPLAGAHQAIPCDGCHKDDASLQRRIPASVLSDLARRHRPKAFSLARFDLGGNLSQCQTCHADPHGGQFDDRIAKEGCTACHSVSAWSALKFDHDRDTRFALAGKHAQTPCSSCHVTDKSRQTRHGTVTRYRGIESSCDGCHADPHAGQFADKTGRTECSKCHDTSTFVKLVGFKHAPPFTAFVLEGKHAEAKCESCHVEVKLKGGKKTRRYTSLPSACEGCHQDFHQGEFKGFVP